MTTTIKIGHVLDELAKMPEKSVHMVWTSVPYWGLRSYGTEPQVWGGDSSCDHEWGNKLPPRPGRGNKPGDISTSTLTNPERQDTPPTIPAVILDCFGGSGTTALVAEQLGRDCILIELNPEYAEIARKRIKEEAPLLTRLA